MALKNKQLKAIHELIYTTKSHGQICDELKISRNSIWKWMQNDEFVFEYTKEKEKYMEKLGRKAMIRINDLIDSESERIALDASKTVLDKIIATKNEVEVSGDLTIEVNIED